MLKFFKKIDKKLGNKSEAGHIFPVKRGKSGDFLRYLWIK